MLACILGDVCIFKRTFARNTQTTDSCGYSFGCHPQRPEKVFCCKSSFPSITFDEKCWLFHFLYHPSLSHLSPLSSSSSLSLSFLPLPFQAFTSRLLVHILSPSRSQAFCQHHCGWGNLWSGMFLCDTISASMVATYWLVMPTRCSATLQRPMRM